MKAQTFSAICLGVFSILLVNSAFAQDPKRKTLPSVTITSNNVALSNRVLKNFTESFKGAENVRWSQPSDYFLVQFDLDEMKHNALYMKRGYRIYHVGYGFEKDLPSEILKTVKLNYGGYVVNRVFKVDQNNRQYWYVNLQSPKNLVSARIQNGVVQEVLREKVTPATDPLAAMIRNNNFYFSHQLGKQIVPLGHVRR